MSQHAAIYITNNDNKKALIEKIQTGTLLNSIAHLKGALFSEITLNKFIEEEINHGRFDVVTSTKNSLQHSSEGERKAALLNHIISQNPEYLIVDNVFGNLDIHAQAEIEIILHKLSERVVIIQITNRKNDILSFIKTVYKLEAGTLVSLDLNTLKTTNKKQFKGLLPQPQTSFNNLHNPLIKFTNVCVSYGERPILNNINWEIKAGEFWQLIGPNGSGKSTILSMIFGDNPKAYGQDIVLFGTQKGSGESVWDIKRNIGYFSFDMLRGFKRLDAIGNMIVSGFFDSIGLYKTPTNQQIKIVNQWLEVLNMFDIRTQPFLSLSVGHQRLVLIARAMLKQPPLLILDEPTNGLDDADANLFVELINKIAKETKTAILYVSHRTENNLKPDFIYQLIPTPKGSVGKQL